MARFIGERLMRAHPGDITLGDAWAGWPDGAQSVEEALTRDIDARESASAERRR
jgi:hypothetical protein